MAAALDNLVAATNYADWIVEMAQPYLGAEILEVGAGHGTLTDRLANHGKVTATDLSERCVATLRQRYDGVSHVEVLHGDADAAVAGRSFDSAVLVNVLEHIPDDRAALRALCRGLRPGGTIFLFVPAFEELYGEFDRLIGHYRRYRREQLAELVREAGFEVVQSRYVNCVGAIAWWLMVRCLGRFPNSARSIQLYDRLVTPVVRRIESRWAPPLGQSVLCVGRRPAVPLPC